MYFTDSFKDSVNVSWDRAPEVTYATLEADISYINGEVRQGIGIIFDLLDTDVVGDFFQPIQMYTDIDPTTIGVHFERGHSLSFDISSFAFDFDFQRIETVELARDITSSVLSIWRGHELGFDISDFVFDIDGGSIPLVGFAGDPTYQTFYILRQVINSVWFKAELAGFTLTALADAITQIRVVGYPAEITLSTLQDFVNLVEFSEEVCDIVFDFTTYFMPDGEMAGDAGDFDLLVKLTAPRTPVRVRG